MFAYYFKNVLQSLEIDKYSFELAQICRGTTKQILGRQYNIFSVTLMYEHSLKPHIVQTLPKHEGSELEICQYMHAISWYI